MSDLHDAVTAYRELSQSATAAMSDPHLPDQATRDRRYAALMRAAGAHLDAMPPELAELVTAEHEALAQAYDVVIANAYPATIASYTDRAKAATAAVAALLNQLHTH